MVDVPSLSREETVGLVVVLTPIGIMSWYSMGSLALHSRILTLVLSMASPRSPASPRCGG